MKLIKNVLLALVLVAFVVPETAHGQLLNRLKERAKDRVERKVEDKAEQAVDRAVDEAAENVEDAAASAFERRTRAPELNLGENETGPASATSVQYKETTHMDLGALGRVSRLFGRNLETQVEHVSISGSKQRSDSDGQSTIVDLETGTMIMLDHEKKTYSKFTFKEMAERADQAVAQMKEARQESRSQTAEGDVKTDIDFDLKVERTGRQESINGTPSEQVLIVLRADFDVEATDESGETGSFRGSSYMLTDSWMSRNLAGIETIEGFARRMGQSMGSEFQQTELATSFAAMGMDPRMSEAMKEAGEELGRMDGMPIRSTMHFVMVPEGREIDVEQVLRPREKSQSAEDLAMRMEAQQGNDSVTAAEQVTLFSITTYLSDLKVNAVPANHFDVPAGYREVDLFQN